MKKIRIIIRGNVQGVFFRKNVCDLAKELNVNGYVMNIEDYVQAVFIGSEDKVNVLLEFCAKGPEGAKVKSIEMENYLGDEIEGFEVR